MTTPFLTACGLAALALGLVGTGAGPAGAGEPAPYGAGYGDAPPHARPGQCFQKVERRPVFETVREQVVDQPARVVTHVIPAQTRWEDRQVLVSPGRFDERAVPEQGHDVTETVVVRPPTVRVDTLPPVYDVVPVQVMVSPGRTYWKPTWGPTGEILCLVSEPALYATRPQTVVREPARTVQTPIPGETRVVVRHVVDVPARVDRREVPPVFRTDHVQVTIAPEHAETETLPATYRMVERQRLVTPGGWEWREIACAPPPPPPCPTACGAPPPPPSPCATCLAPPSDAPVIDAPPPPPPRGYGMRRGRRHERMDGFSARPANVTAQMQTALRKRGYYKGPVDGLYTGETGHALEAFEHDNGLPSGPPTPGVARALGVY